MAKPSVRDDLLTRSTFVAFDTETTGLWAFSNRMVEIAAVRFRLDSDTFEEFQTLIDPERKIPGEVIKIHGITDEMVVDAPKSPEALSMFMEFCGSGSLLVAHNAPFDMSFIGNELDRAKFEFPPNLILDTVDIYRRFYPGLPSYSLISLARKFRLTKTQEHRGLSDAHLVRRLMHRALKTLPIVDDTDALRRLFSVYQMSDWKPKPSELPAQYADLVSAIENRARVEIAYKSSVAPDSIRVIRPIQVQSHGTQHYIVAFCEKSQEERTFRLDRIVKYSVLG